MSARTIIESATSDPSEADFARATQEALNNIDWSSGDLDTVKLGLGHGEDDDYDPQADENEADLRAWMREQVNDAWFEIDYRFQGDSIRIYRVIMAPKTWTPGDRHPGIYWSWQDAGSWEAYWGEYKPGNVKWKLTALAKFGDIDWVGTLAANASPSLGDMEKEIRLRRDAPVKLEKWEIIGR